MKINDIVRVSNLSRSRLAGLKGKVEYITPSGEVRVSLTAYVDPQGKVHPRAVGETVKGYIQKHLLSVVSRQFTIDLSPKVDPIRIEQIVKTAANDDVFEIEGEAVPEDYEFKYRLGQGVHFSVPANLPIFMVEPGPTDDCKPFPTRGMAGFVSDQWIEDGIPLYNIVFLGTYKVIPESWINYTALARRP